MTRPILLLAAVLLVLPSCGGPGLPPAGPKPGEVDIGYDTKPAAQVTGAITSVSGEKASSSRPANLEELLRGRVAGLQVIRGPGGRAVYRIRGVSSLQQQQEPLFVVDGVRMTSVGAANTLSGLTIDDILQVDVLKDVASTSVYGTGGAGGVILITTRR
jgi:TonB-dependent starch-binding outer membrane protein SusC